MTFYRESKASASELAPEAVHFLAAQESEQRQREKFVEQIATHADERPPRVSGREDALTYLAEKLQDERLVVAIDELLYLVAENESLPSYFQSSPVSPVLRTERQRRCSPSPRQ